MTTFISYPRPGHNSGAVTTGEYEALAGPGDRDGLVGTPALSPIAYVDGTGLTYRIRPNRGMRIGGVYATTPATEIVDTVSSNAGTATRTDLLVARLTRSTGAINYAIIPGTAGAGAPLPLNDPPGTGYKDLPLLTLPVGPSATAIAAADAKEQGWYISPSGVACRSTTMPPIEPGLVAAQYDTGDHYIGTATPTTGGATKLAWQLLQSTTPWTSMTLAGGFQAVANATRRLNGVAYGILQLRRTGGTLTASRVVTLATLPAGSAPPYTLRLPAVIHMYNNAYPAYVQIASSTGVITIQTYPVDIVDNAYIYLHSFDYPVI